MKSKIASPSPLFHQMIVGVCTMTINCFLVLPCKVAPRYSDLLEIDKHRLETNAIWVFYEKACKVDGNRTTFLIPKSLSFLKISWLEKCSCRKYFSADGYAHIQIAIRPIFD